MRASAYRNTKFTIPNWVPFNDQQPRGLAYEAENHFVHIYGKDTGIWVISPGLTVTERKYGSLREWIDKTFGAVEIEESILDVGDTIAGVWRPGLSYLDETLQGLSASALELRRAQQALQLLMNRLDELLVFIEPSEHTLNAFGHKTRELLILACTEVENYWRTFLNLAKANPPPGRQFTTNDYFKLKAALYLGEYVIELPRYPAIPTIHPFRDWSMQPSPTTTLAWYDAYNKTKHDRASHFHEASLLHCIQAVAANVVLFVVRFGYSSLLVRGALQSLFDQLFSLRLDGCKPSTFFVPKIQLPENQRDDLICFGSQKLILPRNVTPLRLP